MKPILQCDSRSYSVEYSFTITLLPKLYRLEPEVQYDRTFETIYETLSSITDKLTLIAECTKSMNIHYHGIIKFPQPFVKKQFFKCFRNDAFIGFTNLKQIDKFDGWVTYIKKSFSEFVEEVGRRPVVYDGFNILSDEERSTYALHWGTF